MAPSKETAPGRGIAATGPDTVTVTLKYPYAPFNTETARDPRVLIADAKP